MRAAAAARSATASWLRTGLGGGALEGEADGDGPDGDGSDGDALDDGVLEPGGLVGGVLAGGGLGGGLAVPRTRASACAA